MTFLITQSSLTLEFKNHIYKALGNHSIRCTGINGLAEEPIAFEIRDGDKLIGCVVVQLFWGQLHIKYLLVEEPFRSQGIGRCLMEHAFEFGKKQGCHFAFVETLSFQAPEFYQKLGFKMDFVRHGYDKEASFYYLRKDFGKEKRSEIIIRPLTELDIPTIVESFAEHNWAKPSSTFEKYLTEQNANERLVWIARLRDQFVGYVTLKWQSNYPFFQMNQIPEIKDLNVLPPFRKMGVGSQLLETAETTASTKSTIAGIGVGLYDGYGEAQKLYIKHGYLPDGQGITYNYQLIVAGSTITLDDDLVLWFTKKLK